MTRIAAVMGLLLLLVTCGCSKQGRYLGTRVYTEEQPAYSRLSLVLEQAPTTDEPSLVLALREVPYFGRYEVVQHERLTAKSRQPIPPWIAFPVGFAGVYGAYSAITADEKSVAGALGGGASVAIAFAGIGVGIAGLKHDWERSGTIDTRTDLPPVPGPGGAIQSGTEFNVSLRSYAAGVDASSVGVAGSASFDLKRDLGLTEWPASAGTISFKAVTGVEDQGELVELEFELDPAEWMRPYSVVMDSEVPVRNAPSLDAGEFKTVYRGEYLELGGFASDRGFLALADGAGWVPLASVEKVYCDPARATSATRRLHVTAAAGRRETTLRVAVLDFHDSSRGAVTPAEIEYLADLVRGAARRSLDRERYLLMTRGNILDMLPDGQSLGECVGECAVETGRNIGANYVITGDVTRFGGEVRVTIQLYDTHEGNLLRQGRVGAQDVLGVEQKLESEAQFLLRPF